MTLKSLLKDWTLPLSMVVGTISYVALTQIEALHDTKVVLAAAVPYLLPSLIFVCIQFIIGKRIGTAYNDTIATGQGLAQKNTILSIWMAMTFLNPQAAIGPGACLLWQNVFNSWQIWDYQRKK